jgi:hypothetical protein
LKAPTDESAFRYAIEQGQDWPPFKRSARQSHPTGAYEWSRPSDKGRYLIGTLRLFGDAEAASDVLLHKYWNAVFESLGSTIGDTRLETIKTTLKKRLREGTLDSEDEWERLARLVAAEARQVRMPLTSIDFEELEKRHAPYLDEEKKALDAHKAEDPDRWLEHAKASLPNGLKGLCIRGILHQGYEWRCRLCNHTNWNSVTALHPELFCKVCGTGRPLPVSQPWNFRLHGFVLDGLKEHGLLALVWALKKLERNARQSFYFLPPHELFDTMPKDESKRPNRELDLLCVIDGDVHLVEAKSSLRSIDLTTTVDAAKRLRPDVVTLAIMESLSKAMTDKLNELKIRLDGIGMTTGFVSLEPGDFDDRAFLP